jgi:hypothetical protein
LFAGIAVLANQVAGHRLGLINPPCTGWRPGSAQLFVPNWPAPPACRPRSHIY